MTPLPAEPNPLVGTWKLVSFQFEAEGTNERLDVYDEHPVGFIIFTADWRVLALVTASERARSRRDGSLCSACWENTPMINSPAFISSDC